MFCKQNDEIYNVQVPRVFRYLTAELSSVGIKIKVTVADPKERYIKGRAIEKKRAKK